MILMIADRYILSPPSLFSCACRATPHISTFSLHHYFNIIFIKAYCWYNYCLGDTKIINFWIQKKKNTGLVFRMACLYNYYYLLNQDLDNHRNEIHTHSTRNQLPSYYRTGGVVCDMKATALDQYYRIEIHCSTVSYSSLNKLAGFVTQTR